MLGTVSREAGCEYVEHGLLAFLLGLLDNALSAPSQGSKNIVYVTLDTATIRSKISASGLVVKSNVAIVGPRVRFTAGAFFLLFWHQGSCFGAVWSVGRCVEVAVWVS